MITRETLETQRDEYSTTALSVQLDRIAGNLQAIAAGLADPAALESVRDLIDECMAYTEWTGLTVDDGGLQETLVASHRLMGRLRHDWDNVVASAVLRDWIRRDVAASYDSVRALAGNVAA